MGLFKMCCLTILPNNDTLRMLMGCNINESLTYTVNLHLYVQEMHFINLKITQHAQIRRHDNLQNTDREITRFDKQNNFIVSFD